MQQVGHDFMRQAAIRRKETRPDIQEVHVTTVVQSGERPVDLHNLRPDGATLLTPWKQAQQQNGGGRQFLVQRFNHHRHSGDRLGDRVSWHSAIPLVAYVVGADEKHDDLGRHPSTAPCCSCHNRC